MTFFVDGKGFPLDFTPLKLKCGTLLYRACFCNKQAMQWYTTTYPNIVGNTGDCFRVSDPARAHTFTYAQLRLISEADKAIGLGKFTKIGEQNS